MDTLKASRIWVQLNSGKCPEELSGLDMENHDAVWAEMEKVRPYASSAEVNRLWAESQGIEKADIMLSFGKP